MFTFIKALIDWGVTPSTTTNLKKCIRLCNASALILGVGLIPYLFLYWRFELFFAFSAVLFLALFNFSIPYANKLGFNLSSRTLFILVNYAFGFTNSTLLGQESYVYLYLVAGFPAAVILFRYKEYRLQTLSILFAVTLIVIDLVFNVVPFYQYTLTPEVLGVVQTASVLGALSCSVVFILFFRYESDFAQKKVEQLAVSKQILNNDLDAVMFCGEDGRIAFANKAAEELFGYKKDSLVGLELDSIYSSHHRHLPNALRQTNRDEDKLEQANWRGEVALKKSSGTHFTALLTQFVVRDESGHPVGMAATARDITHQKHIERALIEAKENAEEAAKVKANFLATMSHEIRTPLNGVIGMAQLLIEDNPKTEQIESLKILKFAGENLLTLINDVLDFSKIDAGRITLESVSFSLSELAQSINSSSKYVAFEKGITFTLELDKRLAPKYKGDPMRLTQILLNLTSNAIKFTQKGHVSLDVTVISDRADAADVEFKVSDTGIGIAQEKLTHIFEQFSQADSTITRHYGGSGLGLSITKGLLDAFDSEIRVESEEGKGTQFSFVLTMNKEVDNPSCIPSSFDSSDYTSSKHMPHSRLVDSDRGLSDLTILVAEDNPVNVMVIEKWLTKWGINFDIVQNGEDAVQRVKEKSYDLVIMDIQMPVMDGFQATLAIRSVMNGTPLPVMALTATTTEEFVAEASDVGMDDYLGKPFKPDHLKSKIKQLCFPVISA